MTSLLEERFKEVKELLSIIPSSVLFHQPDLMKLNEILLSAKKPFQCFSIFFFSGVSFPMFFSIGFMPGCMTNDSAVLSPDNEVRRISLNDACLYFTEFSEFNISKSKRFEVAMKLIACSIVSLEIHYAEAVFSIEWRISGFSLEVLLALRDF